jgi:thiol-disulfide isomerase/thioredoxin
MDKLLGCSPDLQLLAQGGATTPVSALADTQVVGLYFSAHWCPPCRGFTPKLAEAYTAIKGTGKSLEIVFVSSDRDEVAFDSYHKDMPWLALPFAERALKQTLSKRFKVSGIPSLVLLDGATGQVISKDGRSVIMSEACFTKIESVQVRFAPTMGADGDSSSSQAKYISITRMPHYKEYSFEEIRVGDYLTQIARAECAEAASAMTSTLFPGAGLRLQLADVQ